MPRTRESYSEEMAAPRKPKYWEPSTWSPRHEIVARLKGVGISNNKIAELTGLTPARVSIIVNDSRARPATQGALASHGAAIESLHGRFSQLAPLALDRLSDQMQHSEDERIAQRASLAILDRAGYTPVQKQLVLGANIPEDAIRGLIGALSIEPEAQIDIRYSSGEDNAKSEVPAGSGESQSESVNASDA